MNPSKESLANKIIKDIKAGIKKNTIDVVICPPFPFLHTLSGTGTLSLGAQDVSFEKEGAFTGDVSVSMLRSLGVQYVILGHSERRAKGETSEMVVKKAIACLNENITPVICVGEKVRDASAEHWQEIKWQLVDSLQGVGKALVKKCVIAYEPVWAIGKKGKPMSADDVDESTLFIKKVLVEMFGQKVGESIRIIYGGSVDAEHAEEISLSHNVSGFLVGRASLVPKEFIKIVQACL